MALQHGSPSSSSMTPHGPPRASGSGRASGSAKKKKGPRSSVTSEVNLTPSRATIAPSPKGKEKALPGDETRTPSELVALPPVAKNKTRRAKRNRANGESSSSALVSGSGQSRSDHFEAIPIAQNEVSRIPPVWSKDGRFYFTVTHTSIHVHSSTSPTFARLSTLSSTHSKGHIKPITSLSLSPVNAFHLVTSSQDGTIKVWDWVAGRLVRTIEFSELHASVDHLALGQVLGKWWIFAAVTHRKDASNHKLSHRVLRVSLSGSSPQFLVGKLSAPPAALTISPRGTYLVALAANKAYTYRMPVPTPSSASDPWDARPTCVKFVSDQTFTCGRFCPEKSLATASEEEWFATGDEKGVIRLWHGLAQAFRQVDAAAAATIGGSGESHKALNPEMEKRLPTTSLHWHAHAVSAIAFTPSGSQLLSVGEESVLVQWHLASGKREYIPRLGGRPIISLAVRNGSPGAEEEWWMTLADGAVIRVGASSNHIANVGQGIRLDPLRPTSEVSAYPIALHPATGSLVVPSSHPSTLQFIDPVASTVLFDLEVAPSNRISRRDEKQLEPVAVEKVAFSNAQHGQSVWMATMEGRKGDDAEGGGLVKNLKLWKWTDERYLVNTQFPRPHGTNNVTSVVFSPVPEPVSDSSTGSPVAMPYLLTASADGTAKLWNVRQSRKSQQGKVSAKKPEIVELHWSCRSTFDYRGMPIYDAAFSSDATIVALAHGNVVTLWDVESNIMLKVLDTASGMDIRQISFVGTDGRYLVGTGEKKGVVSWDLLSCEVAWSLSDYAIADLVTSPAAAFFLTCQPAGKTSKVSVFSPSSADPVRVMSITKPVQHLALLPDPSGVESASSLHLIGVASSGEIYRFGDKAASAAPLGAQSVSASASGTKGLSIWQEMFGKDAFIDDFAKVEEATTATSSALQQRVVGKGRPSDVFDGPSHTMPPTSLLFDAFMDELLSGHTASAVVQDVVEDVENDAVLYGHEPVALDAPQRAKGKERQVEDEEVKELEVFFRQVLSTAPASAPAKVPSHKKLNGHMVNGDALASGAHTAKSPKKRINGHGTAPHGDVEMNGDEGDMEVEITPKRKAGGKKRKAAREGVE
ncbi:hypothetical protein IAU60_002071 [Kwoniella sp. DSM 27419]